MSKMLARLRPQKINFYLRFMREQGFDADAVLDGTGLQERQLASPHAVVEVSEYIRVINNINRLSRSPSLAFALGEQLSLGDLGILGYCVMTCRNTNEAVQIWHKYNPIFFGNLIEAFLTQEGGRLQVINVPYPDIREDLLQFLIEEKICYDLALHRLVGMESFPIKQLTLTFPAPAHAACYDRLVQCPISFAAGRNAMVLWDDAMAIPLKGHDPETHEVCLKLLNDIWHGINAGATLSHKVKAILVENARQPPAVTEVADKLCMTSRTLNRALGKEGLNFMGLAISIRLEMVKNMLTTTHLESKEIAERVGFSDVRCLRRFFKTHTGQTLQQFRAETVAFQA